MRIMRLNCSHGDHDFYRGMVARLREYLELRPDSDSRDRSRGVTVGCAVALDLKGPEIRTGTLAAGEIRLEAGDTVSLVDKEGACGERVGLEGSYEVYCDYTDLWSSVKVGSPVYIDDGLLQLLVTHVQPGMVTCVCRNAGSLGERKGVNLPGAILGLPAVSEKDQADIKLGASLGVDFIFASFVRKADHVDEVRWLLESAGSPRTMVISKIENQEGLDNFAEILEASDGIMVARGDLGIEIPAHEVVRAQKRIISMCNAVGKPVICATQMLESMVTNPRPTRAEVSDVANAVLDGADCVMLSGETAKGKYPLEAIEAMSTTAKAADELLDYGELYARAVTSPYKYGPVESVAAAAVRCAAEERAAVILVVTDNGTAARFVSKYRPCQPVLAATTNPQVANQLFMYRGITPLLLKDHGCPIDPDGLVTYDTDTDDEMALCELHGVRTGLRDDVHKAQLREDLLQEGVRTAKRLGILSTADGAKNVVAVVGSSTTGLATMRSFPVR